MIVFFLLSENFNFLSIPSQKLLIHMYARACIDHHIAGSKPSVLTYFECTNFGLYLYGLFVEQLWRRLGVSVLRCIRFFSRNLSQELGEHAKNIHSRLYSIYTYIFGSPLISN